MKELGEGKIVSKKDKETKILEKDLEDLLAEDSEQASTILVQDQSAITSDITALTDESEIPEQLPILPLRGVVVYPHTAVPLTIGQPRSINLVDEAVTGSRLIGLVASKKPELEHH